MNISYQLELRPELSTVYGPKDYTEFRTGGLCELISIKACATVPLYPVGQCPTG